MRRPAKVTSSGHALLNLGCGGHCHPDWNNLDLHVAKHVIYHDLRRALPFDDGVFDAVYHSHVLEHLTPEEGNRLIREIGRVLKPQGTIRIAVPDLERICEEYLQHLRAVAAEPSLRNRRRYEWIKIEMFDQMVREVSGGRMGEVFRSGDFDLEYVDYRIGDLLPDEYREPDSPHQPLLARVRSKGPLSICRALLKRVHEDGPIGMWRILWKEYRYDRARLRPAVRSARDTGELHKWMYDRVSLQWLLEEKGFQDYRVCRFDESRIPGWDHYQLDRSLRGEHRPRKPDSIFVEATKTAPHHSPC